MKLVYESIIFNPPSIDIGGYIYVVLLLLSILSLIFIKLSYKYYLKMEIIFQKDDKKDYMPKKEFKLAIIFLIIFFSMPTYGFFERKFDINKVVKLLEENQVRVIEGKINNFHEMPLEGHDKESFKVKGITFEITYSGNYPSTKTLYFTLTKNRSGPIKENGQVVKIYYVKDIERICIPFTDSCLIFEESNKIIKLFLKKFR
jgi:hypothetical protein